MAIERPLSRREMLALAALGAIPVFADAEVEAASQTEKVFTPSVILGPFYSEIKPGEQDPDLAPHFHTQPGGFSGVDVGDAVLAALCEKRRPKFKIKFEYAYEPVTPGLHRLTRM